MADPQTEALSAPNLKRVRFAEIDSHQRQADRTPEALSGAECPPAGPNGRGRGAGYDAAETTSDRTQMRKSSSARQRQQLSGGT